MAGNRLITGKVNLNSDFFSSRVFKRDQGDFSAQKKREGPRSFIGQANDGEESKNEPDGNQALLLQSKRNANDEPHRQQSNIANGDALPAADLA